MTLLLLGACFSDPPAPAPEPPPLPTLERAFPPTARLSTWQELVADRQAPRHPADGGGHFGWAHQPPAPRVGEAGSYSFLFEVGPGGIAEGGALVFTPPPFWGWSTPQHQVPGAVGYTALEVQAEGVWLDLQAFSGLLMATVRGRALQAGERVLIHYGAGPAGARADRFAEGASAFTLGVDGDGDGVRALVAQSPTVQVLPGPAARLWAVWPSTALPGSTVTLRLSVLDSVGNARLPVEGEVALDLPAGVSGPAALTLRPADRGVLAVPVRVDQPGVYTVGARWGGLEARTPPLACRPGVEPVLWADLQVHTALSDGTGELGEVYAYAREVAGLDAVALTDHDAWGMRPLDRDPARWAAAVQAARAAEVPGSFVVFPAFEWTSWLYGHRHVLFLGEPTPLLSSLDPATDTPAELWAALADVPALTVAHHSAGGPVAVDWSFRPDPRFETVTEIVSVHGQSESFDAPGRIYDPVRGNFVHDQLKAGLRLGFLGSTDGHDGHPGLSHLAGTSGGLAALVGAEPTRESVAAALRERRVYATNGERILLRATLSGQNMGAVLPPGSHLLEVRAFGTGPIDRVELVGPAGLIGSAPGGGSALAERWELGPLGPGDFVYVRVIQADGAMAWSSPFFIGDQSQ